MSIPTAEDLTAAHNYAMMKMCTEIPKEYGANLTYWNESDKTCRITQTGCNADLDWNPLSKRMFNSDGEYIDQKYTKNTRFKKIWARKPPQDLSWKKLSDNTMGCGKTNFLFRNFCENPVSRSTKQTRGLTTGVPPLDMVIKDGKEYCRISKAYCDAKGISYNSSKEECYVPTGQFIAEMLTGTVLVRDIRSGDSSVSDRRLKTNIRIYKKDFFGPGIHMYVYNWNDTAQHLYNKNENVDIGIIADDLPEDLVYYDCYGYKNIDLSKKTTSNTITLISIFYDIKNIFIK